MRLRQWRLLLYPPAFSAAQPDCLLFAGSVRRAAQHVIYRHLRRIWLALQLADSGDVRWAERVVALVLNCDKRADQNSRQHGDRRGEEIHS